MVLHFHTIESSFRGSQERVRLGNARLLGAWVGRLRSRASLAGRRLLPAGGKITVNKVAFVQTDEVITCDLNVLTCNRGCALKY